MLLSNVIDLTCGFGILYITYRKYVQGYGVDKYDMEFYRRNKIFSIEDIFIALYTFTGVIDCFSAIITDDLIHRLIVIISGSMFVLSAYIIYCFKYK